MPEVRFNTKNGHPMNVVPKKRQQRQNFMVKLEAVHVSACFVFATSQEEAEEYVKECIADGTISEFAISKPKFRRYRKVLGVKLAG